MRNPGQYFGRRLENLVDAAHFILEPGPDELLFCVRDLRRLEQAVDVKAVSLQRRDAARRRVRLFQVAHHFQIEHFVANRRGADA